MRVCVWSSQSAACIHFVKTYIYLKKKHLQNSFLFGFDTKSAFIVDRFVFASTNFPFSFLCSSILFFCFLSFFVLICDAFFALIYSVVFGVVVFVHNCFSVTIKRDFARFICFIVHEFRLKTRARVQQSQKPWIIIN